MYALIAAEFHLLPSPDMVIDQIHFLAQTAEKRRSDRAKALAEGKQYVG